MSVICTNCGKELPDGAKFCGGCGAKVEAAAANSCAVCGNVLKEGAKFCNVCGSPVAQASQPAEAAAPTMEEVAPPVIDENTFAQQPAQAVENVQPTPQPIPTAAATEPVRVQPQADQFTPYPDPAQNQVKSGEKGGSLIVPIILIILILAVIAVDVFVLFPDRIFGSDKKDSDSGDAKTNVVVDVGNIKV